VNAAGTIAPTWVRMLNILACADAAIPIYLALAKNAVLLNLLRVDTNLTMSKKSAGLTLWLGIAMIVVLLDQLSKITLSRMMVFGQSDTITSFFNLVMVYNRGAAFSFLADQPGWQRYFFAGVSLLASLLIIWMLMRHSGQRLFCWAMTLILGGALGNLIDRIAYGHVIDFLDFHVAGLHWPAFNVADSAITVGAVLFILDELRRVNR
jgi:signal peptidase II